MNQIVKVDHQYLKRLLNLFSVIKYKTISIFLLNEIMLLIQVMKPQQIFNYNEIIIIVELSQCDLNLTIISDNKNVTWNGNPHYNQTTFTLA